MFVGKYDILADGTDAEAIKTALGDSVVHYQEINGGHLTFVAGKKENMGWLKDMMDVLEKYEPLQKL